MRRHIEMQNVDKFYGYKIRTVKISSIYLNLDLGAAGEIQIYDAGQRCCEYRYMTTDDDIQSLVGGILNYIKIKSAPDRGDEEYVHEIAFLEIGTSKGFITIVNHNEHNGYYGGFDLGIEVVRQPLQSIDDIQNLLLSSTR